MPICVTGMHRSGTSMVARLVHELGVDFGPHDQLLPADVFNADGYWENRRLAELSDRVLDALDGGWDAPPDLDTGWEQSPSLEPLYREAEAIVADLGLDEPWGWKDPRAALTLPFWRRLHPELRVVVCVRHPVEVALSLQRRGATSPPLALSLWESYNARLLRDLGEEQRIVVHYDRFFADTEGELTRLAEQLGLPAGPDELRRASDAVQAALRHHGTSASDFDGIRLPPRVGDLYAELCGASGAPALGLRAAGGNGGSDGAAVGASLVRTVSLLQERDELRRHNEGLTRDRDGWKEAHDARAEELRRAAAEQEELRTEVARLLEERGRSARRAEEARVAVEAELDRLRRELQRLVAERDAAASRGDENARELARVADDLEASRRELEAARTELEAARTELEAARTELEAARERAERVERDARGTAHELTRTTADRDRWRAEAARLVDDRNNWQVDAQNWRRETERLLAINERRVSRRGRRVGFRTARFLWWKLPRRLRDFLRPIIFKSARTPAQGKRRPGSANGGEGGGPGREELEPETLPPPRRREPISVEPRREGPVSVVIPTLNAGPGFARLLAAIRAQEGVDAVELIVADSRSTDETARLAAEAGARVLPIEPEQFGHGRTRNEAAELASHDVLVLLVQDAVLLGRTALRDLAAELRADPRLAGLSARQVPRSDADLYGAFVAWSHDYALRSARAGLDGHAFDRLDPLQRRAAAALDDVCAAVRREVWAEYRFRDVGFAEDLEFAVRAARSGWTFDVSASVAVAHSHDRDSVYHLRRSVADRLYVSALLEEPLGRGATLPPDEVLAGAAVLLEELAGALAVGATEEPSLLSARLARVASVLGAGGPRLPPAGELARLAEFVASERGGAAGESGRASLDRELAALLRWPPLVRFAHAQPAVEQAELVSFAAKLAASVVGRALGDAARSSDARDEISRLLSGV